METSVHGTVSPYSKVAIEKLKVLLPSLLELTDYHVQHCESYARGVAALFPNWRQAKSLVDLPFMPVSLFKQRELKSIAQENVFKVMTSSGTGGAVSRIFLDAETAKAQTLALSQIMQSFIGGKRLPMLIIDTASVIKDRKNFSARGAGILGMLNFGRNHLYALRDDMSLDVDAVNQWLEKHRGQPLLLFGFTFMVWQHFFQQLLVTPNFKMDLSLGTLIHSGGWKKLIEQAVTNDQFKVAIKQATGISAVHNFYGMVEQVGSIFVECEQGCFHAPLTGDVIVRHPETLEPLPHGEKGIVQVMSQLPRSYPGHSLLTEDEGTILGVDDCPCNRLGTRFLVHGRLPRAELRGCSDTHAASLTPNGAES